MGCSVLSINLGALTVGLAPTWTLTLLGVFLIGLGYGALTIGLNSLFAAGFGCLFSLGIGVEASTVGYTATYLVDAGLTSTAAAMTTSLFFIAFTLSRLLAVPLSLRFTPAQLVVASLGLGTLLLLLSHSKVMAPYTMIAVGACLGAFFPNCFNWLSRLFGATSHTVLIISGALLGAIIFPALIALIVSVLGESYIVSALLGLNFLTLMLAGSLWFFYRIEMQGSPAIE